MKNKKFIVLLIALIALIALIFTVAFLAGRDNKSVDHSVPAPTETTATEVPTEITTTIEPTGTGTPDLMPNMMFDPWETGSPDSTPSVSGPVSTNISRCQSHTKANFRVTRLSGLRAGVHSHCPRHKYTRVDRS